MKRKADSTARNGNGSLAKAPKVERAVKEDFNAGLLDEKTANGYRDSYAESGPYKHAVVQPLIADSLLRSVRQEIVDNIHFTPKETDIYRIFQSGDLANLDGLPEDALAKLPSLLRLRDALYSPEFRAWISKVSNAGPVSGKKTDMAINVYKPGCHLLCHDDVIGSRRVSYILYLTDPDTPWKAEWGGALRLYPTTLKTAEDGRKIRVPDTHWSKVIPPAWNQLSFFAVQPGESFHDVEEVYHAKEGDDANDGGRVRMAISGWFHIPQEGEEGYEEGLEEKLAEQSSLQQLQAKNDALDLPQIEFDEPRPLEAEAEADDEDGDLTQQDLDFLLKYISPNYLTPDTVEELSDLFQEESSLQLSGLLSSKIIDQLKTEILTLESTDDASSAWTVASPPHKHRYFFRQPSLTSPSAPDSSDLLGSILSSLVPSAPFQKWLSLITGVTLGASTALARRFRAAHDYTLATSHDDPTMQLEYCLNLTPSEGWTPASETADDDETPGGYEMYMAADDDDEHAVIPATGGGNRRPTKADPAVYKAADEDDGILFSAPPAWNTLSVVLRDEGTLRFVKYVSKSAKGDRWDVVGSAVVVDDDDEGEDGEDEE